MSSIEESFNFDDVYLRDLTVAFLETLNNRLWWTNQWSDEIKKIEVPFYYSLTGDERFLLNAFLDDIPGTRVELNIDAVPRGIVTLNNWTIKSGELTNPNVWLKSYIEEDDQLKSILAKTQAVPLQMSFDVKIRLKTEIDLFKLSQAMWKLLLLHKHFEFEHNFMKIEATMLVPDQTNVTMNRDIDMASDNNIISSFTLEVHSYFPVFSDIQRINIAKRVNFKNYVWKLPRSGEHNRGPKNDFPMK